VGLPPTAASRELEHLARLGLALRSGDGRRIYYEVNPATPVLNELRGLVFKLGGIAEALRMVLREHRESVYWAFIHGSMADGTAKVTSDVDVFVVGDVNSITLHDALLPTQERLGREISTFVLTPQEFRTKRAQQGGFVRRVLASPKIELIGDEQRAEAAA